MTQEKRIRLSTACADIIEAVHMLAQLKRDIANLEAHIAALDAKRWQLILTE